MAELSTEKKPFDPPAAIGMANFNRTFYGAALRQKRIACDYRKAEDFIADMDRIGCAVSKPGLYRIERGEQDPSLEFFLAANLVLCGDAFSDELVGACVREDWINPTLNPATAEIARKGLRRGDGSFARALEAHLADTDYQALLDEASWFDYRVFVNGHTTDNELYVSIADSSYDETIDHEDFALYGEDDMPFVSYRIVSIVDIERAVIQHLKRDGRILPNDQIKSFIRYVAKIVEPYADEYSIGEC